MSLNDCVAPTTLESIDPTLTVPNVVIFDGFVAQLQPDGVTTITVPAMEATWDLPTNHYVLGIQFEYFPTAGGASIKTAPQTIAAQAWVKTDGIVPQKIYSIRWRAVGPGTFGDWSAWEDITILTNFGLAGADGVLTSSDLYTFLWTIDLNLNRFDAYVPAGGTTTVGVPPAAPFTAFGTQQMSFLVPGGAPSVKLTRTGALQPQAAGYSHAHSFLAVTDDAGGSTIRLGFRDAGGVAFAGLPDQVYALTTVPTVFTWDPIASDAVGIDNPLMTMRFFDNVGDIVAGKAVLISDLMMNLGPVFGHGLVTPWRPSPDEDDLLRYAPLLTTLFNAKRAASPLQRVQVTLAATAHEYAPIGPTSSVNIAGTAYTLSATDMSGGYRRCTNAALTTLTIPTNAAVPLPILSTFAVRADGIGGFLVVGDTGVTVKPNLGGTTGSAGQYDVVQYVKVGTDLWDTI